MNRHGDGNNLFLSSDCTNATQRVLVICLTQTGCNFRQGLTSVARPCTSKDTIVPGLLSSDKQRDGEAGELEDSQHDRTLHLLDLSLIDA